MKNNTSVTKNRRIKKNTVLDGVSLKGYVAS